MLALLASTLARLELTIIALIAIIALYTTSEFDYGVIGELLGLLPDEG